MRMSYLKTSLIVLMLLVFLIPLATWMSDIQEDTTAYDAEHVIRPLISLYQQSAVHNAQSPVFPLMPIEEIWAIEDTHTQAVQPLISGMRNGDQVLGYDAVSQTFFCTIGVNFTNDAWPKLELYAQGADEDTPVHVAWAIDYWYDTPSSAVAEGYAYELFAYTEHEYQHLNIVFTGLPIVTLQTELDIQDEYIPACVSISSSQYAPITTMAQVHLRGGGYAKQIDKHSYRIELQKLDHDGRADASPQSVLGMEADSDWLLLANASNREFVHNYLAFDLYNRWSDGEHLFMQQQSRLVELFIGNEYMGMYQLMERVDPQKEILSAGGNLDTDMAVRIITRHNPSDKPIRRVSSVSEIRMEYLYAPNDNADAAFSSATFYSAINDWLESQLTDEEFIQLVETHVDIENFLSLYLFYQIAGLTWDNTANNLYIYMLQEDEQSILHLAPWDMDSAFFYGYFTNPEEVRFTLDLHAAVRMLDLNVMNCREMLHSMYQRRCETILSNNAIDEWILSVEQDIGISSAYLRESEKWYGEPCHLELTSLLAHQKEQVALTNRFIHERWPIE